MEFDPLVEDLKFRRSRNLRPFVEPAEPEVEKKAILMNGQRTPMDCRCRATEEERPQGDLFRRGSRKHNVPPRILVRFAHPLLIGSRAHAISRFSQVKTRWGLDSWVSRPAGSPTGLVELLGWPAGRCSLYPLHHQPSYHGLHMHGLDTYMTLPQFSLVIIVRTPCISSGHSLQGYCRFIILPRRTGRTSRPVEIQLQFHVS
jgi:hypothetical protein